MRFYNILNHSKCRKIEKDMPKCSVIRLMFGGGHVYPMHKFRFSKFGK
jgi:hypothetical protein